MQSMVSYSKAAMERAMKVQEVILRAIAKKITWRQAAEIIGISDRHMAMSAPPTHQQLRRSLFAALSLMFGMTLVIGLKKRRCRVWVIHGSLLLSFLLQTACGASNSCKVSGAPPPTNYTVTVTATSGALQQTTPAGNDNSVSCLAKRLPSPPAGHARAAAEFLRQHLTPRSAR
jgi:hypothetical protein